MGRWRPPGARGRVRTWVMASSPPGSAAHARHERDGFGDPVDGEIRAHVQLADQPLVAGREQREHHLIDRHEDRTDVLDPVALRRHRRAPPPRDEGGRRRAWRGRCPASSARRGTSGARLGSRGRSMRRRCSPGTPDERGDYPDQSVGWRLRHPLAISAPELGPRVDAELLVDAAEDVADGLGGEERALGDLAAGEAVAASSATRRSVSVSSVGACGRRPDAPQLRPRDRGPVRRPERLEAGERLAQRLVGESLLLPAAMEAALRQQRPAALERHRQAVVRLHRRRQQVDAPRRGHRVPPRRAPPIGRRRRRPTASARSEPPRPAVRRPPAPARRRPARAPPRPGRPRS